MEKGDKEVPETMTLGELIKRANEHVRRVHESAKKYTSPLARDMALRGDDAMADYYELGRLEAATFHKQGDVIASTRLDRARLDTTDKAGETVVIRIDTTPNATLWLEIQLPLAQLEQWIKAHKATARGDTD